RLHSLIHCHSLTAAAPHAIYTLSLHDALPIFISSGFIIIFIIHSGALRVVTPSSLGPINFLSILWQAVHILPKTSSPCAAIASRSEEHTSELQSRENLVCRLLLEKKNKIPNDA